MKKIFSNIKLHIKTWKRWHKYSTAGRWNDVLVLFRIRKPLSFSLVKMGVVLDQVAEDLKKARKELDGYNAQRAVCDEVHCWKDRDNPSTNT